MPDMIILLWFALIQHWQSTIRYKGEFLGPYVAYTGIEQGGKFQDWISTVWLKQSNSIESD